MPYKNKKIRIFVNVFGYPLMAAMTGFGLFWLYRINHFNVWISLIVSLYITALTMSILKK